MKWVLKDPSLGDMIRVKAGSIYHFGVFVDETEVIQFGLAPCARQNVKDSDIEICSTDIDTFLCGGFLEVAELDKKELKKRRPPKETVQYARSRLGEKGYNILYNNCEHFANECVLNEKSCLQTDSIRQMFKSMPIADVYVATIPEKMEETPLYPPARMQEVLTCTNEQVKRQRYYAWKLLEYALERTFGYKISNLTFEKTKSGKWTSPTCFFSISHSEKAVAVALSRKTIGVDVEILRPTKNGFIEKVLTKTEKGEFSSIPETEQTEYLIGKWTEKESIFKTFGENRFQPAKIETAKYEVKSKKISVLGEEYMLSVAGETLGNLRFFENIALTDNGAENV